MSALQPGDRESLWYFYKEKGDVTRCSIYELAQDILQKEYPELLFAVNNLKAAERLLDAVMLRLHDDEAFADANYKND